ncbi:hypothetical protein [Streptomyces pyxinae]
MITLMWEARAAEGRGAELLAWARAQPLPAEPVRRETFTAPGDRVLVLTWWDVPGGDGDDGDDGMSAAGPGAGPAGPGELPEPPELPEPDAGLVTRPVHRWRFESQGTDPAGPATGPLAG